MLEKNYSFLSENIAVPEIHINSSEGEETQEKTDELKGGHHLQVVKESLAVPEVHVENNAECHISP